MRPLGILLLLLSFFGHLFLGRCLHVSNQVSESICEQHQKFTESGELQPAQKAGPASNDDTCGWYHVKQGKAVGCAAAAVSFIECRTIEQRREALESPGSTQGLNIKPESGRIVGGEDAAPHEFPSIVALKFEGGSQCGGTIIHPEWVVTAAHCIGKNMSNPLWEITAGQHKQFDETEPSRQIRKIVAWQMHELYGSTGSTPRYDIAVMKVDTPFEINDQVKPVILPEPDYRADGVFTICGWGAIEEEGPGPDTLVKAQVPLVLDETCAAAYVIENRNVTEDMICAGYPEGGTDSCQGDSGGPMYKIDGDKQILAGITSFGYGCAKAEFPGVYTEVAYFVNWIKKNTCMA